MRTKGRCKWWSQEKGWGFITPDDGSPDVFCHFSAIRKNGNERRNLTDDEAVEFDVVQGQKGLQAADVVKLGLKILLAPTMVLR